MADFSNLQTKQRAVKPASISSDRITVMGKNQDGQTVMTFIKPKQAKQYEALGGIHLAIKSANTVTPYDCDNCRDLGIVSIPVVVNGRQYEAAVACFCQENKHAGVSIPKSVLSWNQAKASGLLEGF